MSLGRQRTVHLSGLAMAGLAEDRQQHDPSFWGQPVADPPGRTAEVKPQFPDRTAQVSAVRLTERRRRFGQPISVGRARPDSCPGQDDMLDLSQRKQRFKELQRPALETKRVAQEGQGRGKVAVRAWVVAMVAAFVEAGADGPAKGARPRPAISGALSRVR
jgi:hypothetical protein